MIEAAAHLKEYSHIRFLIYGDGSERNRLEAYCQTFNLTSVVFKDKWISLRYVPYVLSCSSLNILNYRQGFGKYGISSGKFFSVPSKW